MMLGSCTGEVSPVNSYAVNGLRAAIVKVRLAVAVSPTESVTFNVNALVPVLAGVPEIGPPLAKASSAGNDPEETVHTYPALPPEAATVVEYVEPTVPAANPDDDMVSAVATGGGADCIDPAPLQP